MAGCQVLDLVQRFWLKNSSSLHERVRLQLKECVDSEFVPSDHLLFMDDLKLYIQSEKGLDLLVQTVRVFSKDIVMEFGVESLLC